MQAEHIHALGQSIGRIEKAVLGCARELPLYAKLLTLPGIGRILAMTITMEVGEIRRFQTDGDFASYCRLVDAKRLSNGKCKGDNNQKCGNQYLSWAFVEGSNFARRHDEHCRRWYDRKAAKTSRIIATKVLGCKLAKAVDPNHQTRLETYSASIAESVGELWSEAHVTCRPSLDYSVIKPASIRPLVAAGGAQAFQQQAGERRRRSFEPPARVAAGRHA